MGIEDLIVQGDMIGMWRQFKSDRDSMQAARDRCLNTIQTLKTKTNFLTIASPTEKQLVDDTDRILRGTLQS